MKYKKTFYSLILAIATLVGLFFVFNVCGCQTKIGEVEWIENPEEVKEENRIGVSNVHRIYSMIFK